MMKRLMVLTLLAAPMLTSIGCGGSGNAVRVTGKLVKGGAAYVPPNGQYVDLTFVGLETRDETGKIVKNHEPYQADLDEAGGRFTVPGRDGRGIPPGKYRVAVVQKMTRETFDASNPKGRRTVGGRVAVDRETDLLADRFGLTTSPIVREVGSSTDLTIDLDNPAQ